MKKLIILILLAICLTLTACTDKIKLQKADENVDTTEKTKIIAIAHIGDTVKVKNIEYTLNEVRESEGQGLNIPGDGKVYYIVDLTIENKGVETYPISSASNFSLLDKDDVGYTITFGPDTNGSIDGEIMPGKKIKGEVAFEIAKNAKGLKLEIKYNPEASGSIIFKLNK